MSFILINKPSGMTSHDVVDRLRRITGIKKIGHAGTLDPFATGLLICGIGREATKRLDIFLKQDKEYIAQLKLGFVSDTYDRDGKIEELQGEEPSLASVKEVIGDFEGEIEQKPPMFSAKKIKGKKLYQLARKGIEIELKPHKVFIHEIDILNYNYPVLEIRVNCSSGTYIRSLANDIVKELGCGAYLQELCRTKIGNFTLTKAVKLSVLAPKNWQNFLFDF